VEVLRSIEKNGTPGSDEFALAAIYSALGDRDHAIAALEKGVQMRSLLPFVFVDPQLDPLRSDPRFQIATRGWAFHSDSNRIGTIFFTPGKLG
jgi:hypothetical protein